jgi:hypothetical protein
MVSVQHRRYTVEIYTTEGAWLTVANQVTKAKALAELKAVEAEGYNARLWSEVKAKRGRS